MRTPSTGAVWVDLGGGTGSNIEFYGAELAAKWADSIAAGDRQFLDRQLRTHHARCCTQGRPRQRSARA